MNQKLSRKNMCRKNSFVVFIAFVGIRSGMKNWRLLLKGGQINATLDTTVSEEQV